jgi:hypothetical protein
VKFVRTRRAKLVVGFSRRELRELFSRAQVEARRDPEVREQLLAWRAMRPDGTLDWARIDEMERLARALHGSQGG